MVRRGSSVSNDAQDFDLAMTSRTLRSNFGLSRLFLFFFYEEGKGGENFRKQKQKTKKQKQKTKKQKQKTKKQKQKTKNKKTKTKNKKTKTKTSLDAK